MHPSQGALLMVVRDIALGNTWIQTQIGKFPLAKGASKKAALILPALQLNEVRTGQRGLRENHLAVNPCFRNGHNELSAPFADECHLFHDFILEIPGQDEDVIRS